MTVFLEGIVNNIYVKPEYKNQEGKVTPRHSRVQLMTQDSLKEGGFKNTLHDIKVNHEVAKDLSQKVGKMAMVKCGLMSDSKIIPYGLS